MATRASHSSPCFLRLADASAASSASKITSLSTPFSLETASTTIRISLFTRQYLVKFRRRGRASGGEPRLANLRERDRYPLLVHCERDPIVIDREQLPRITAAPGARLLQFHEHPRPDEAAEVLARAQHAVEPGRGHFQRVGARNRVLDVEQRRDLPAHLLAIPDAHSRGGVDEHAHLRVPASRAVLELDQLV